MILHFKLIYLSQLLQMGGILLYYAHFRDEKLKER